MKVIFNFSPQHGHAIALVVLALVGCSKVSPASDTPDAAATPTTFIANEATFQGFRSWTAFHSDGPPPASVSIDVRGPRTQYLNKVPQHRSTSFPVGTIIVEARESGAKLIFAAVKRGGGYNAAGAVDWEWFELDEDPSSGAVSILWRGLGPPATNNHYGGTDRCNFCHMSCADNDYACSEKLKLSDF
jgi:hypothetical protein